MYRQINKGENKMSEIFIDEERINEKINAFKDAVAKNQGKEYLQTLSGIEKLEMFYANGIK